MKVHELIERLEAVPQDWEVIGTWLGSLEIHDESPDGYGYGFVFTDGREARMLTDHRKRRARQIREKEKV
jgi:hypothetical protein